MELKEEAKPKKKDEEEAKSNLHLIEMLGQRPTPWPVLRFISGWTLEMGRSSWMLEIRSPPLWVKKTIGPTYIVTFSGQTAANFAERNAWAPCRLIKNILQAVRWSGLLFLFFPFVWEVLLFSIFCSEINAFYFLFLVLEKKKRRNLWLNKKQKRFIIPVKLSISSKLFIISGI